MLRKRKLQVEIMPQVMIVVAVILITIPARLAISWIAAAVVHELCHILATVLSGARILSVRIGANGTTIYTSTIKSGIGILCSLAGPIGGFLVALFCRKLPILALCALIQSTYNLLPFSQLDGGRAISELLHLVCSAATADMLCRTIEMLTLAVLTILAFGGSFVLELGYAPIVMVVILVVRLAVVKIPCKH